MYSICNDPPRYILTAYAGSAVDDLDGLEGDPSEVYNHCYNFTSVQYWQIPLLKYSGKLEDGADTVGATIPLGSEFTMLDGTVNANGIEVRIVTAITLICVPKFAVLAVSNIVKKRHTIPQSTRSVQLRNFCSSPAVAALHL